MMGITHVVIGTTGYVFLKTQILDSPFTPLEFGAVFIGSLIPDIDHPKSWLGKRLWFISHPLARIFGHRGLTHSLLGLAIISILVCIGFSSQLQERITILAFCLGYSLHLLADWNTSSGIPLLWPSSKRYKAPWAFSAASLEILVNIILVTTIGLMLKDNVIFENSLVFF